MYQTQIEMAELRRQDIAAWAAREHRARAATCGQPSLWKRLAAGLSHVFAKPQAAQSVSSTARAGKRQARTA